LIDFEKGRNPWKAADRAAAEDASRNSVKNHASSLIWRSAMPTVELILRDDEGRIIDHRSTRTYSLDWRNQSLHCIEGAVEEFKKNALPDLQADLLEAAQNIFIQDKKKT